MHKGLKREAVDVDHLNSTVLHGMMNVNLQGIPSIQKKELKIVNSLNTGIFSKLSLKFFVI